MAIAEIELPDGRVVELEVPDGTSETQIMQWIQQNPQALESATKAAPKDTGMGMSEMLGLTTRALTTALPGPVGEFVGGTASGIASIPEGVRQAYNKLTGDEEELASLNADYEKRRNMLKELTGDSTATGAGELVGQVGPFLMTGGVAAPAGATSVLPMTARAVAGGALGGAAGGYVQALTPEQEAQGQRESGALTGAILGGVIPAVAAPIKRGYENIKDVAGRMLPRQALNDFLGKAAGVSDDTSTQSVVDALRGKVKDRTTELQRELGDLYDAEKNIPGLPPVSLDESAKYDPNRTISEILGGYGIGKRVAQKNQQGALQQFVDPQTGKITYGPAARDFGDVRQYLSYLKNQASALKDSKPEQATILNRIIKANEDDLTNWANQTPEARQALDDALALDKRYAQEVVPLIDASSGRPVAKWREAAYDEEALNQIFMGQRAGTELRDLTTRIPGSEEELKKYLALQLRNMAGREPARLGNSTTTEQLFTRPERAYMAQLKGAIEKEADDTGIAHNLAQLVGRVSGGFPEKLRYGVQPYGTKAAEKTDLGALTTALRAAGLFRYNSGEE